MLFKGQLITVASGKLNGTIFSHNRGGPYTRAHVIPTFPNTTEQQNINGAMAWASAIWPALSAAQREAWAVYSRGSPRQNRIGDARPVGARQEMLRVNVIRRFVRAQLGITALGLVATPPAPGDDGTEPGPVASLQTSGTILRLAFAETQAWASESTGGMLIWASPAQPGTVNWFKGPFTLIACSVLPGSSTPTIDTTLPSVPAVGQHIFWKCRASRSDGRLAHIYSGMLTRV